MSRLDTRIPPPLVALLAAALAWMAVRSWPTATIALPGARGLALVCVATGFGLDAVAGWRFLRRRTSVNPMVPGHASRLVCDGPYRFTRNPMYLGQALALLGLALWWQHPAALIAPALYVAWITRFQIRPEERVLQAKFGPAYTDYCQRVRRWL